MPPKRPTSPFSSGTTSSAEDLVSHPLKRTQASSEGEESFDEAMKEELLIEEQFQAGGEDEDSDGATDLTFEETAEPYDGIASITPHEGEQTVYTAGEERRATFLARRDRIPAVPFRDTPFVWSAREERLFVVLIREYGRNWAMIAQMLPGRDEEEVASHYTLLLLNHPDLDLDREAHVAEALNEQGDSLFATSTNIARIRLPLKYIEIRPILRWPPGTIVNIGDTVDGGDLVEN